MKRIYILMLGLCISFASLAQNTNASMDDFGRIAIRPVIVPQSKIPSNASNLLKNKLTQILTKTGMSSNSLDNRFILTANADLLSKEATMTAPPMIITELAVTVYIGDVQTGQLYGSYQFPNIKGMGNNDVKSYLDAVKKININDPGLAAFVDESKTKIVEYYNSQIDFIINEAKALLDTEKYNDAILLLSSVPNVCKEAHEKAMAMINEVYQKKIDTEGEALYNRAYTAWKASNTKESAEEIVALVGKINPLSSAAPKARELSVEIEKHYAELEARRREIEEREWAFEMQKYNDEKQAAAEERAMDHQYRMTKAKYDADVAKKAYSAAAEVAKAEASRPVYNYTVVHWW